MDKPTRTVSNRSEEAERLVEVFRKSSRDHSSTLLDDEMCIALAQNHSAIEQALMQIQRDMSRPVATDEATKNLNAIFQAMSQINSRLLEMVDRGQKILLSR
jgi:hypothetical protein